MKKEEALEQIRKWDFLNEEENKALKTLISELAESEDERIRKHLIEIVETYWGTTNDPGKAADLAYLEKQKDLFKSGVGLYYYDGEKTVGMGYPATEENPYDFAMSQQEEKQKEQKLNPDKEKLIRHCIGLILTDATGERFKDYGLTLKDCLTWLDEQKEQKPENWDDVDKRMSHPLYVEGFEAGRATEKVLSEHQPAEWSEEDEEMLNSCISSIEESKENRYAYRENDGDTSYDREISWLKSLRPQPQRIYQQVVEGLRDMCDRYEQNGTFTDERARDFLSNVRIKCKDAIECVPILDEHQWKPSEEQIATLEQWLKDKQFDGDSRYVYPIFESLYNDLKKLIAKKDRI